MSDEPRKRRGMFRFSDLEQKFGSPGAYHWLTEIEKAAQLSPHDKSSTDPEIRLQNALRAQDEELNNDADV